MFFVTPYDAPATETWDVVITPALPTPVTYGTHSETLHTLLIVPSLTVVFMNRFPITEKGESSQSRLISQIH